MFVFLATDCGGKLASDLCTVRAADYDQSCSADSDCVAVGEGNACEPTCVFACRANSAINTRDLDRYQTDLMRTPAGRLPTSCQCPAGSTVRCIQSLCSVSQDAKVSPPAMDGGTCGRFYDACQTNSECCTDYYCDSNGFCAAELH